MVAQVYGNAMEITRSKPSAFKGLDLRLKELEGVSSSAGWYESSKYENGTPVAQVAFWNEYGHGGQFPAPARPFMRPTVIRDKSEWRETAAQGAKAVLAGQATATDVMGALAIQAEAGIAKSIAQVFQPELSPVTLELRAMKERNPDLKVSLCNVYEAIRNINKPGYKLKAGVSTKPLNDSGILINTLNHAVVTK